MDSTTQRLAGVSLLDSLRNRRSRRFGYGMEIPAGPFAYRSQHAPLSLGDEEEAAIAFAGAGITGYALADLSYGPKEGGTMVAGLVGRTVSSADAIQSTALVVTNDEATYLIKRPADLTPGDLTTAIKLSGDGELTELYRRMRVKIRDGRCAPPLEAPVNFSVNKWSLYAKGGSYFLPINDVTRFYINGVMEMFDEGMDLFIVDERAAFRPAGIEKFGKSKGGPLHDNPLDMKMGTIAETEMVIAEMLAIELGMMLQNIHLMAQAIGLGAWPNFARHEFGWFEELGFRMKEMPATKFFGAAPIVQFFARMRGREVMAKFPIGLEVNGDVLLKPYIPPYYKSMREAVYAIAEEKFGSNGVFRGGAARSAWQDPSNATPKIPKPKDYVIEATAAYCEYIYQTYGRFPAYMAPFRTCLGSQVTHVDLDFYERFFRPEAISDTQRQHFARWHH